MSLREAYELVIAHELVQLGFDEDQVGELVKQLSSNQQFHEDLTDAINDHIDDFGSNYGL